MSKPKSSGLEEEFFQNDVVNLQKDLEPVELVPGSESKLLVIYTGGTFGMKNTGFGYSPDPNYLTQKLSENPRFHNQKDGQESNPTLVNQSLGPGTPTEIERRKLRTLTTPYSLFRKRITYSILEYHPLLDSSNMTMADWIRIATDIEVNYELFDAFLVLHGTDTMAYTASALSFLLENLGKTVIITGSQVPISEVRTDAIENLLGAMTIAGHFTIPEVGLFFDNHLLRGNRSSKVNAVEFNAFESPNHIPLVNVGINIDVNWDKVWRAKQISKFRAHKVLNPNVASLRLFPGITRETVNAFFSPSTAGVILETYGSGNAPSNRPEILQIIKEACDRGVVVVNCSQCKKATVNAAYETGVALLRIGVVPGADMTPECALTKLTYLLGKWEDPVLVRGLMRKSLRGELTVVHRVQKFAILPKVKEVPVTANAFVSSLLSLLGGAFISPITEKSPGTPRFNSANSPTIESITSQIHNLGDSEDFNDGDLQHEGLQTKIIPLAIIHAIRATDISTLSYLMAEFGHMVNVSSSDGYTPLHAAARAGNLDCLTILLESGANVHVRDAYGQSALSDAAHFGHSSIIEKLRSAGAHFSAEEQIEISYRLTRAVLNHNVEMVKNLILAGANPNSAFMDGRTALHVAATNNAIDIVAFLVSLVHEKSLVPVELLTKKASIANPPSDVSLNRVAELHLKNLLISREPSEKKTSIYRSTNSIILPPTIDLSLLDRNGKTALDEARKFGHNEIISLLI